MCASGVSVAFLGTKIIRLNILSWMARRWVHCDRVRIQLPEQYSDDVTHDDYRRSLCRNATLFSRNNFRIAQNDLHAIPSRSTTSFTKWPSNVVHTPKALKPCSLGVRVITVSSNSIFATRQPGADVHHTDSFHAIRSPAQLSAKSSSPTYLPPTGSSHFSAWHFFTKRCS